MMPTSDVMDVLSANELGAIVGRNSQRLRRSLGMSLSVLARLSGVARATLYQLEAGTANPTLETLNSVATVLGVTLGDLVSNADPVETQLVRSGDAQTLHSPGVEAKLMRRFSSGRVVIEVYTLDIEPGHTLSSPGHQLGVVEHLLLHAGHLTAGPQDAPVEMFPGDYMTFRGDVPHIYRSDDLASRMMLLMQYPSTAPMDDRG